jgi:hypothetical protein
MNRNEFIKELEKIGFKEDSLNNSMFKNQFRIFPGENGVVCVLFGTDEWKDVPLDFKGILDFIKR